MFFYLSKIRMGKGAAVKSIFMFGMLLLCAYAPNVSAGWLPDMQSPEIPTWLAVYANVDQPKNPSADIFGLAQFGYYEQKETLGQFKVYRMRPGIKGTLTDDLSYWILGEFGGNAVTAASNGAGKILDASLTYSLKPVRIQLGQMVIPFGADMTANGVVPWVNYSDVVQNLYLKDRVTDTVTTAGRELGISAWQEFKLSEKAKWLYFLGAFNGTGLSGGDTNKQKDIIANTRLKVGPFDMGTAYWTGKTRVSGQSDMQKDKYDFFVYYGNFIPAATKDKIWALFEYMATREEQVGGGDIKADGIQTALGFRPTNSTMLTYRYSTYNQTPVTGLKNEIKMSSIIGQYFYPKVTNLRFLVEYDFRDNKLVPTDKNILWFQVSVPFSYKVF